MIHPSRPSPDRGSCDYLLNSRPAALSSSIRILIADYYDPWRRTVRMMLEKCPDWEVVAEARDGIDAVYRSRELQPNIVLMEIRLPILSGLIAAEQIRKVSPNSKIVFFSNESDEYLVRAALKIGRWGYVLKSDAAHDLLPALKGIINDKPFVSDSLSRNKRDPETS